MKRALIALSIILSACIPFTANAAINSPGTACKQLGASAQSGLITVECTKVSGKLVWAKVIIKKITVPDTAMTTEIATLKLQVEDLLRSIASLTQRLAESEQQLSPFKADAADKIAQDAGLGTYCVIDGSCLIGSTGPGGGIVFYDAGSQRSWGRYLEFAPNGWSGKLEDPAAPWCNLTNVNLEETVTDPFLKASLGLEIGKGPANTNLMLAHCNSGAAVLAHEYKGGGKSDWFLPSKDELNELCKYARGQATGDAQISCNSGGVLRSGFLNVPYASSSDASADFAWAQFFQSGFNSGSFFAKRYLEYVRPVRAF